MLTLIRAGALALLMIGAPATAFAQDHSATLQDGRTVVVLREIPQCPAQAVTDDPRFAINLAIGCDGVGDAQASGDGALVVAVAPGQTTPREYLVAQGADFWPDATEAERESQIIFADQSTPTGQVRFLCIAVENDERTYAGLRCVLDQSNTQMMLGAEAATGDAAVATLNQIIGAVTISPATP